jgi:hypothetical protein
VTAILWAAIFSGIVAGIVIGIIGMLWLIDSSMRRVLRGAGI